MIEDLIKQKEEIEAKIAEQKKGEPTYQSLLRIKKFEDLISATQKLIVFEIKGNPFILQMKKFGYKTDFSSFPLKLDFEHKTENASFSYFVEKKEVANVLGIDNTKLKTLESFLQGKF